MRNNKTFFANIDWSLVFIYLLMLLFGWLNIYAANYDEGAMNLITMDAEPGKQLFWIATFTCEVSLNHKACNRSSPSRTPTPIFNINS